MYKYVIKRLVLLVPVILGIIFIIFAIMALTPGNPGRLILGERATQEAVDELNEQLGYNKPFLLRYVDYVVNIVTEGDFGTSYRTQEPVFNEIVRRFPVTLQLALYSIIVAVVLGIPLGILSAVKQYSKLDTISVVTAMFAAAIPGFWLGLMLILVFALKLGWLPSYGNDTPLHYILPTLTLAINSAASLLRMTRSAMLETIRQDYIKTVRAKGANEKTVIFKHALKNALLPVITVVGMDFGRMLGGAIIVESVFSMPGLGTLMLESIRTKDIPQVLATAIFLAVMFCLIMLFIDILYSYIDPRIKAKYVR